ncbi:MAG: TolC family protein [Campylobacteraceae bacterium]|nr:TolC family protein [Campylobacteraceae bacterium]
MNLKRISLALSISILSLSALSIEEAVNTALLNNQDILVKNLEYKQKQENTRANKAGFLPTFDLSYSYLHRNKLLVNQTKDDSSGAATLSYNLFNGFKSSNTLQSAIEDEKASSYLLKAKKQDIILSTKSAYISYLNLAKQLETYISAFELFEKQYNDSNSKFEQGLLAKNDLLKIHINMLDAKQNVVKTKADLKTSKDRLSNIMGGKDLRNEGIEELKDKDDSLNIYAETLLENRSEIKALLHNIKAYKNILEVNKATYYPKIDASYSFNKYGDSFSLGGRDGYPSSQNIANLSATWNLYNGGKDESTIKIARMKIRETMLSLEKLRLDIKLQYSEAVSTLDVAVESLVISKLALSQAFTNYTIVSNRFNEGVSSTTDLIDANYLLSQAKQRFYGAFYSKFLAYASLDRVTEK